MRRDELIASKHRTRDMLAGLAAASDDRAADDRPADDRLEAPGPLAGGRLPGL